MKQIHLLPLLIAMAFFVMATGCTTTDSTQINEQTTTVTIPTQQQSVTSEPFIIKSGDIPEEITITYDAKPVNENTAVLIYYTLDSTKTDSYSNPNGWKIIVTAFAYNTENVHKDFNPDSIQDIMDSKVPYESRSIHVYPNNVYSDKIEISDSPSDQKIDLNEPYNYGILFTLQ